MSNLGRKKRPTFTGRSFPIFEKFNDTYVIRKRFELLTHSLAYHYSFHYHYCVCGLDYFLTMLFLV